MKRLLWTLLAISLLLSLLAGCSHRSSDGLSPTAPPQEYFQVLVNTKGVVVFPVIAGCPTATYTHPTADGEPIEQSLQNENGEINGILFDLLNGKSTVSADENAVWTHRVTMAYSYTVGDASDEVAVAYAFQWSSDGNTLSIFKNNAFMGAVLLTDGEKSALQNALEPDPEA